MAPSSDPDKDKHPDSDLTAELEAWTSQVTRRRFILGVGFAAAATWARPLLETASAALPDDFGSLAFPQGTPPGWPKPSVSFALIGDFGAGNIDSNGHPKSVINPNSQNVGEGVARYAKVDSSAYVVSVGDNVYVPFYGPETPPPDAINAPPGSAETYVALNITPYDQAIGALYSPYIKFPPGSTSVYAAHGAKKQRFFTVIGDHDWWHQPRATVSGYNVYEMDHASYPPAVTDSQTLYYPDNTGGPSMYLQYFGNQGEGSTSGNTRYWDVVQDKVHWIGLSSDPNETILGTLTNAYYAYTELLPGNLTPAQDNLQNSAQGRWFRSVTQQKEKADWRFVITHYSPYTSSAPGAPYYGHNPAIYMQWGYENFGVDMVFSGHVHAYERLYVGGVTYVVCGAGGTFESLSTFATGVGGPSVVQVENQYGFLTAERGDGKFFFSYLSFPPADESGATPSLDVSLSDRFVLLKKGLLNTENEFAELKSIHVTPGGGAIKLGKDYTYAGDLVGLGALTKQAQANFILAKASPNFTGELIIASGRVTLGLDQTLAAEATVTLNGGTLGAAAIAQDFRTPLSVQKPSEIMVDAATTLTFANSSAADWKGSALLTIRGALSATGLRFGDSSSGLTAKQLARIRFQNPNRGVARLTSDGYLVAG